MRSPSYRNVLTVFAFVALSSSLVGCPEKGGADKTTAEPERAEPDEEGKADKKPSSAPPATPSDDPKPDEDKDKGGW